MARAIPDESQVLEWLESLKNWGRWGPDDQLGLPELHRPGAAQAGGVAG